jgi:hypothetical protein
MLGSVDLLATVTGDPFLDDPSSTARPASESLSDGSEATAKTWDPETAAPLTIDTPETPYIATEVAGEEPAIFRLEGAGEPGAPAELRINGDEGTRLALTVDGGGRWAAGISPAALWPGQVVLGVRYAGEAGDAATWSSRYAERLPVLTAPAYAPAGVERIVGQLDGDADVDLRVTIDGHPAPCLLANDGSFTVPWTAALPAGSEIQLRATDVFGNVTQAVCLVVRPDTADLQKDVAAPQAHYFDADAVRATPRPTPTPAPTPEPTPRPQATVEPELNAGPRGTHNPMAEYVAWLLAMTADETRQADPDKPAGKEGNAAPANTTVPGSADIQATPAPTSMADPGSADIQAASAPTSTTVPGSADIQATSAPTSMAVPGSADIQATPAPTSTTVPGWADMQATPGPANTLDPGSADIGETSAATPEPATDTPTPTGLLAEGQAAPPMDLSSVGPEGLEIPLVNSGYQFGSIWIDPASGGKTGSYQLSLKLRSETGMSPQKSDETGTYLVGEVSLGEDGRFYFHLPQDGTRPAVGESAKPAEADVPVALAFSAPIAPGSPAQVCYALPSPPADGRLSATLDAATMRAVLQAAASAEGASATVGSAAADTSSRKAGASGGMELVIDMGNAFANASSAGGTADPPVVSPFADAGGVGAEAGVQNLQSLQIESEALALMVGNASLVRLTFRSAMGDFSLDRPAIAFLREQIWESPLAFSLTPAEGLPERTARLFLPGTAARLSLSYRKDGQIQEIPELSGGSALLSLPYCPPQGTQIGALSLVQADGEGRSSYILSHYAEDDLLAQQQAQNTAMITGRMVGKLTRFSLCGIALLPAPAFTDTPKHWAREDIDFVSSRGLLAGAGARLFSPNRAVSRAELVTALGRLSGDDVSPYAASDFTDVKYDDESLPYIGWAVARGIASPLSSARFVPDRALTREGVAVMLYQYVKTTGVPLRSARATAPFKDYDTVSKDAREAVAALYQAGILNGKTPTLLNPKARATRAEVSAMLRRYVELLIDPFASHGWTRLDGGKWQYYGEDGKPVTGKRMIDGRLYAFNASGVLQEN